MKKILVIGPSVTKSFGGMVTVINQILLSKTLKESFEIDTFSTYIDGFFLKRILFSLFKCILFFFKGYYKKFDLYHLHMAENTSTYRKMWLARLCKKANKKYIVHVHACEYLDFFSSQSLKNQKRIKTFLLNAEKVIVLSNYWKEIFENKIGINNCVVVNNCIDYSEFSNCLKTGDHENIVFLGLGRIGHRKGTWDIIDAVEQLSKVNPKFNVYLAGDGESKKLEKLIEQKQLSKFVKYFGWANNEQKKELLSKSDVLLLPSYNEGLPMSILESMASGKVIISSYVGAIPEVVKENYNGYLIEPGDVDGLLKSMIKCFDIDNDKEISKRNQSEIYEHYDIKSFEKTILDIYNEA